MLKIRLRSAAFLLMVLCIFSACIPVAYADEITDEPAVEEVVEETPEASGDTGTEETETETSSEIETEATTEETGETETETAGEDTGETETETTTEETEETETGSTSESTDTGTTETEPTVVYIQVPAEDELPDDLYQSYVLGCLFFFVAVILFYFCYKLFAMFF